MLALYHNGLSRTGLGTFAAINALWITDALTVHLTMAKAAIATCAFSRIYFYAEK